jgi:hypothetical protein
MSEGDRINAFKDGKWLLRGKLIADLAQILSTTNPVDRLILLPLCETFYA